MWKMALGGIGVIIGLWGSVWFTAALKESGRWFAITGLFQFGPGWWQNVFDERPGHHAYFQYAMPYLVCFVLIFGGALLLRSGYRTRQGGRIG
ncbi:MAG TPA: hypothetical protein VD973_23475 [Symbiobacteriaceae bacterium]|nr:hypothetical protein [Symbiobacteriaceae bacterium]